MRWGSGVMPETCQDRDAWVRVVAAAMLYGARLHCASEREVLDAVLLILEGMEC